MLKVSTEILDVGIQTVFLHVSSGGIQCVLLNVDVQQMDRRFPVFEEKPKDPGSAAEIGYTAMLSGEDKISEKDGVRAERKCIPGSITGTLVPQLCKCR